MPTLDDRLLPVLVRQHWLVTLADVIDAGGSRSDCAHRVRIGRWERCDARVYRVVGVPATWEQRVLAPILSAGDAALATHLTSAALHGIPGYPRAMPELVVPRGQEFRRPGIRVRTSTDLDRCRVVTINGVPTTDLPRTLLDIGRIVGDARLLRAIEWSRRNRGVTWSDLISTLARHARRGRPGIRRLRRVIVANAHRDEITDSDFELMVLALLLEHGLPEPVLHHRAHAGGRFIAELDLSYPDLKIAIEVDGDVHLQPEVRELDLARQNDLSLEGWVVLRFSWERFRSRPDLVVAEVRAARRSRLSARAAA